MELLIYFFYFLSLLSLSITPINSSRICVFSVGGFLNYRSGFDTLLEALVAKGHELTVLTTLPLHVGEQYKKNIHHIHPKAVETHLETFFTHVSPLEWRQKGKQHVLWDMLPILTLDLCHLLLQDQETQEWLASVQRFDLFIVDSAWNECGVALAHAFQAKLILFSFHSNLLSWNLDAFGAVSELSWIPDAQYESTMPMSFLQKLRFTIRSLRWYIYRNSFTFYQIHKFCMQFLNRANFPSIRELEQNASLVLVNSHFSEEYGRSLPPVLVSVGGVHIRTSEESTGFKGSQTGDLRKKVNRFLGNQSGFILVNIGCSNDTRNNLSPDSLHVILKAMNSFMHAVKFVFVWAESKLESQPTYSKDKILTIEVCTPEMNTLLAHPKIKGLISHGDLLDVQEAIFNAVPMILLPVAFEEDANAKRVERLGRGIQLEIISLKEDQLTDAMHRIVTNSTFKSNMKTASISFRDRQVKPLKSALWWIEYVIRNPDTSAMKPLGIHQTWYSRRLLEIWFFLFLCTITACFLIVAILACYLFKSYIKSKLLLHCSNCSRAENIISRSKRVVKMKKES